MRVGLAIETDSPGGAEVMLLGLARELVTRGHEVFALGPTGGEGWLTARLADIGVPRDLIEFRGPFGLGSVPRIAAQIRARELDVLHSHEFAFGVCGALAARMAGRPHVITMHGGTYWATAARRRLAMRLATALSRHTVVVSNALCESFSRELGVRRPVRVVYNGVTAVDAPHRDVRRDLGVAPHDVLVLAVGNLLRVKGHAVLLEAIASLPERPERVVVAVAGRGPEEGTLRSLADRLQIENDVLLLGYRADVTQLLASADIFVMPSLSEGLPMAMIEAMLAGKPIVASRVGGIPELLPSADHGWLVSPGDAAELSRRLAELIADPEARRRLGAAARARAREHFTSAAMVEAYLSLYAG